MRPAKMRSMASGNASSVSASSNAAKSIFQGPASFSQISRFCSSGNCTESMPSRFTWRSKKGSTVAGMAGESTKPQAARLHPYLRLLTALKRISPPTASMAPA